MAAGVAESARCNKVASSVCSAILACDEMLSGTLEEWRM
jgi:hypothetical protein